MELPRRTVHFSRPHGGLFVYPLTPHGAGRHAAKIIAPQPTERRMYEMAENKSGSDVVKELVKEVKDITGPVVEDVKKAAKPYVERVKKEAGPMMEEVKKKAAPTAKKVKEESKRTTKRAKEVGEEIKERVAKATARTEIFLQYGDYELRTSDVADRVRADYQAQGHKASDIRELQIYIKPEEHAAYYVVNHTETGKVQF